MATEYLYACHKITQCTVDISILTLSPITIPLSYQAGQYVEVKLLNQALFPLSIANAPSPDGQIEFHLRHGEQHELARQFLHQLSLNKTVSLYGPFGNSLLSLAQNQPKGIFLAGGTGFAPIKALLEAAFKEKQFTQIDLYWGICRPEDVYLPALLRQWQQDFSEFRYHLVLSNPENTPSWQGPKGLVHQYCAEKVGHFEKAIVFASGPFAMIKAAANHFHLLGLPFTRFICDIPIATIL